MIRLIALTFLNLLVVLLGVVIILHQYDPGSPVTRAVWILLIPFAALPIGWRLAVAGFPENSALGVVLLNAPCWALCVDWLLYRIVGRPKSHD